MRDGIGQRLGTAAGNASPQRDDPGQRVAALPADLRALDRGAAAGPGFVQALDGEQALDELILEDGQGFGGGGHGGETWLEMRSGGPYVVPKLQNTPLI